MNMLGEPLQSIHNGVKGHFDNQAWLLIEVNVAHPINMYATTPNEHLHPRVLANSTKWQLARFSKATRMLDLLGVDAP